MWKKEESVSAGGSQPEVAHRAESLRPRSGETATQATIGPSITIKGEVSGDEDLLIQGRVEGSVDLDERSVTVGREGRVKANITGRVVTVEGEVEGDLTAQEQVILRSTARVQGDITAPRVVLEDGASFRGLVDMGDASGRARRGAEGGVSSRRSAPAEVRSGDGGSEDNASPTGAGSADRSRTGSGSEKSVSASAGKTG